MTDRIGNCSDCTHWKNPELDWKYELVMMGKCDRMKRMSVVIDEAMKAAGLDDFEDDFEDHPDIAEKALREAKAMPAGREDYTEHLQTTADFGCVLYEEKT